MKFHLQLAHDYWAKLVQVGDTVVDATAGNGHDAIALAKLALRPNQGQLYLFDIQKEALQASLERLVSFPKKRITAHQLCHSKIDEIVPAHSCRLIVFNLGYLPGGDKTKTTMTHTTLEAIKKSFSCLLPNGAISITCYPGHPEGKQEEKAVLNLLETCNPKEWCITSHRLLNRPTHPHLLIVQRLGNVDSIHHEF